MMSFEKSVMAEVAKVLTTDAKASFEYGTLFVECSVADAVKIETGLLKTLGCGIILSRVGNESAFDFV
jgi:homoserine acetyltransferase